ncbi:unnamed protein product, partial [Ilex paraguariensis]
MEGALKELEATLMAMNEEVEKLKEDVVGGFLEGFDNFREQPKPIFPEEGAHEEPPDTPIKGAVGESQQK